MDVLLVEDEPLVREMLQEDLEAAGLSVTEVATAEDGLASVEQFGLPPAVLVTDVNLGPGMDGVTLAAEAQRRWPQVRLVVMTGDERNVERLPALLRESCLIKPFNPPRLVRVVTALMSRTGQGIDARAPQCGLRGG